MDLWILKAGHRIRTKDGSEAVVIEETRDGSQIRIRYLGVDSRGTGSGAEDIVSREQVDALLGIAILETWGSTVSVTLLVERDEDGYGNVYRATTMDGIPHGVIVESMDEESGQAALDRMLAGLRTFGYEGTVSVYDVTKPGESHEYELHA